MKFLIIICLLLSSFVLISAFGKHYDFDYSIYEKARNFHKKKQYVQAYKYLLIFKYTNIKKLTEPQNKQSLEDIDGEIIDLENYLSQNAVLIRISEARGFTPAEIDSTIVKKVESVKLKDIVIQ